MANVKNEGKIETRVIGNKKVTIAKSITYPEPDSMSGLITKLTLNNQRNDMDFCRMPYVTSMTKDCTNMGMPGVIKHILTFRAADFEPYYALKNTRSKQKYNKTVERFDSTLRKNPAAINSSSSAWLMECGCYELDEKPFSIVEQSFTGEDVIQNYEGIATFYDDIELRDGATRGAFVAEARQFPEYIYNLRGAYIDVEIVTRKANPEEVVEQKLEIVNRNCGVSVPDWDTAIDLNIFNPLFEEDGPLYAYRDKVYFKEGLAKEGQISIKTVMNWLMQFSPDFHNNLSGKMNLDMTEVEKKIKSASARGSKLKADNVKKDICGSYLKNWVDKVQLGEFDARKEFEFIYDVGAQIFEAALYMSEDFSKDICTLYDNSNRWNLDLTKDMMFMIMSGSVGGRWRNKIDESKTVTFKDGDVDCVYYYSEPMYQIEAYKGSMSETEYKNLVAGASATSKLRTSFMRQVMCGLRYLMRKNEEGTYYFAVDIMALLKKPQFIIDIASQALVNAKKEFSLSTSSNGGGDVLRLSSVDGARSAEYTYQIIHKVVKSAYSLCLSDELTYYHSFEDLKKVA